ncbi:MAG: nucleoside deaminase [Alphaproteobacteria bacterium]|nr:nucleoside deaminase [Alphaproteobacteria bacterium]
MVDDLTAMRLALEEARKAAARAEVPIGAVLVDAASGEILACAGNETIARHDPSAHAELLVIREICARRGAQRIPGTVLYVTLEPCTQCAAAISFARIDRVVFGASDPKGGAIINGVKFFEQPTCHWRPSVTDGILSDECGQILRDFFQARR